VTISPYGWVGHILLAELVPRPPAVRYPSPGINGARGGGAIELYIGYIILHYKIFRE
jgi:hypothetical protein